MIDEFTKILADLRESKKAIKDVGHSLNSMHAHNREEDIYLASKVGSGVWAPCILICIAFLISPLNFENLHASLVMN